MKTIITIIILGLVSFGIWKVYTTRAPESVPSATVSETDTISNTASGTTTSVAVDTAKSSFWFTGYGPGKEETGTFKNITYTLTKTGDVITGGTIVFENASIDTVKADADSKAKLEKHLCSDDFIDCVKYPTTTFTLNSLENKTGSSTASGVLSFRGVQKALSFPVTIKDGVYSAEIRLDVTPFGFKYTGIKNEVLIKFAVALK